MLIDVLVVAPPPLVLLAVEELLVEATLSPPWIPKIALQPAASASAAREGTMAREP